MHRVIEGLNRRVHRRLLAEVDAGRLDLSPIITARYGLEEAVTAIAQSTTRQDGKIMVLPNQ